MAFDGLDKTISTAFTPELSGPEGETQLVMSSEGQHDTAGAVCKQSLAIGGSSRPAPLSRLPAQTRKLEAAATPHSRSLDSIIPAQAAAMPVQPELILRDSQSYAVRKPAREWGTLRLAAHLWGTRLLFTALASCARPHPRGVRDGPCCLPHILADMKGAAHVGSDQPLATASAAVTVHACGCAVPWCALHAQCCDEGFGSPSSDGRVGTGPLRRRCAASFCYERCVVAGLPGARQSRCIRMQARRHATANLTRGDTRGRAPMGGSSWVEVLIPLHVPGGCNREEKMQARIPTTPLFWKPRFFVVACVPSHAIAPATHSRRPLLTPRPPRLAFRRSETTARRRRCTARLGGGDVCASSRSSPSRRARPRFAAPRSSPWLRSQQRPCPRPQSARTPRSAVTAGGVTCARPPL